MKSWLNQLFSGTRSKGRFSIWILVSLACVILTGCDDARKLAAESREGLKVAQEIGDRINEIRVALSTNDFAKAKVIGAKLDQYLNVRVLTWTIEILATEERNGVDAAKNLIREIRGRADLKAEEALALKDIEAYFHHKGKARTSDLIVLVGALVAESKLGHGGGNLIIALSKRFQPPVAAPATNQNSQ